MARRPVTQGAGAPEETSSTPTSGKVINTAEQTSRRTTQKRLSRSLASGDNPISGMGDIHRAALKKMPLEKMLGYAGPNGSSPGANGSAPAETTPTPAVKAPTGPEHLSSSQFPPALAGYRAALEKAGLGSSSPVHFKGTGAPVGMESQQKTAAFHARLSSNGGQMWDAPHIPTPAEHKEAARRASFNVWEHGDSAPVMSKSKPRGNPDTSLLGALSPSSKTSTVKSAAGSAAKSGLSKAISVVRPEKGSGKKGGGLGKIALPKPSPHAGKNMAHLRSATGVK